MLNAIDGVLIYWQEEVVALQEKGDDVLVISMPSLAILNTLIVFDVPSQVQTFLRS